MTRPLRLGIDAANFASDRRGMGRAARAVLRYALTDPGVAITLISPRRRDERALRDEFGGLPLVTAQEGGRRNVFDAVWFPWNGMRFGVAAPALVTLHDVFAFTEPARGFIARRREQDPILRAARAATAIATDSHFSRSEIVRVLGVAPARVEVVPLAPDPFFFPARGDRLPEEIAGKRYVLLVGAREARKNARTVIEACARALHAPDELLVIAGELGEAERTLLRERRVPSACLAPDDATLRALYRNASAVAVPSTGEGFGLIAAEALACAAPVVAANAAALPETTGDAAILLDPFDIAAWSAALRALLDDPRRAGAWSERAAARFALADRDAPAKAVLALLQRLRTRG